MYTTQMYVYGGLKEQQTKCITFEHSVHQSDTENHKPMIMMAGRPFLLLCEYIGVWTCYDL